MRILTLIEAIGQGGAEMAMTDLVTGLPEHDHVVWHFTRSNGKRVDRNLVRRLQSHDVRVRDVHWRAVADPQAAAHAFDGLEPDVVMIHWWRNEPWLPWLTAARADARRPAFVAVLHSARLSISPGYDRYVAVARFQRERLTHLPRSAIAVVPNAVDLSRFSRGPRAARSNAAQLLVIGSLAGLRREKVPADLMRKVISWDVPGAEWRFAGDGDLRQAFQEEASRSGTSAGISFFGHLSRRRVPRFLSELDVFCHVVNAEILDCNPIAVIEALAAGVPVVAEARGGLPELIEHGGNGLLADSVDDVGAHLRRLADDRSLVRRLSTGARASAERMGRPAYMAAFRNLLATLDRRDARNETAMAVVS